MRQRVHAIDSLLNEKVSYGGNIMTRREVYKDMKLEGYGHEQAMNYACMLRKENIKEQGKEQE